MVNSHSSEQRFIVLEIRNRDRPDLNDLIEAVLLKFKVMISIQGC